MKRPAVNPFRRRRVTSGRAIALVLWLLMVAVLFFFAYSTPPAPLDDPAASVGRAHRVATTTAASPHRAETAAAASAGCSFFDLWACAELVAHDHTRA